MNRNVRRMQKDLFTLLIQYTSIPLENYPNIKVFLSEEEYESVSKNVILQSIYRYGRNEIACIYEYQGVNYLVLPEIYEEIKMPSLISSPDLMPIQFVHLVLNKIGPTDYATEESLLQYVFLDYSVDTVDWSVIVKYFPGFTTFQINDVLPVDENERLIFLKRLCIEAVCQTTGLHQLPFDAGVLAAFSSIASSADNHIPYDNVLRSLLSYHWKFCFIDLYRCQERLLLLAWVDEFQKTMNSGLSLNDLYKAMKNRYSTEHHEDENMRALYKLIPQEILDIFTIASNTEKKADFIYKLRNKIVHFQHSDSEIESMKDKEWNMIILFILKTLPCLYRQLQKHIDELPEI